MNLAVRREHRNQRRRVTIGRRELGDKRRRQRTAHEIGRSLCGQGAGRVQPLSINHHDLVSLLALQRRERSQAQDTPQAVRRVRQQLQRGRHVVRGRALPKEDAVGIECIRRHRLVEHERHRCRDGHASRRRRRIDAHDTGVILVQPHVAEVVRLSVGRKPRDKTREAVEAGGDGLEVERADGNVREGESAAGVRARDRNARQAALRHERKHHVHAGHRVAAVGAHQAAHDRPAGAQREVEHVTLAVRRDAAGHRRTERHVFHRERVVADGDVAEGEPALGVGELRLLLPAEQRRLGSDFHFRACRWGHAVAEEDRARHGADAKQRD